MWKEQALRRQRQRGMTLMEILVVLVLLGAIMALVAGQFIQRGEKAKIDIARIQVQEIAQSLDLFKLEIGRYPTQSEGLQALVTQPSGVNRWNGPYWKQSQVPKDPWHNEYRYVVPGKNNQPYEVISMGPEGREGGQGAISSADL